MTQQQWFRRVIKPALFLLALVPFAYLVWGVFTDNLSANPLDDITDETGTWTLRFIVITLTITPLRRFTKWNQLLQLRRMVGLYAFFYGSLHFFTYLYFDKFFEWSEILADIPKRPFILAGFTAFSLMIPLAATSTDRITKWIGAKRWQMLHRLIYVTGIAAVIHYLWLVKADTQRPLTYGAIIGLLLLWRVWDWASKRWAKRKAVQTAETAKSG